jgi:hypothetical protein
MISELFTVYVEHEAPRPSTTRDTKNNLAF